jgi:hypothetical protein
MRSDVRQRTERFAREYILLTFAQRNWRQQQQPSNKGDIDWNVTTEYMTYHYMGFMNCA